MIALRIENRFLVFVLGDIRVACRNEALSLNFGVTTARGDRTHHRNETEK